MFIKRTWYFQHDGQLRQGDAAEQVQLYIDDELISPTTPEIVQEYLSERVFPPDIAPAFLFDGEQAQRMIFEGGSQQFQREVAVLFGTARVDEAAKDARNYSNRLTQSMGGNRAISQRQQQLKQLSSERDQLDQRVVALEAELDEVQRDRTRLAAEVQKRQEGLRRAGDQGVPVAELQKNVERGGDTLHRARELLNELADGLGLALAAKRLQPDVRRRLRMEAKRETWLSAKRQTEERSDRVLDHAAPAPHHDDPLLQTLTDDQWGKLRERITEGVRLIYEPPPDDYAREYLFGFVQGEARDDVDVRLMQAAGIGGRTLKDAADALEQAERAKADAEQQLSRQQALGPEVEQLKQQLTELNLEKDEQTKRAGQLEKELTAVRADRDEKSKHVRRLMSEIKDAEPNQQRSSVAERAAEALEELSKRLQPIALERLREGVTRHFLKIADPRFAGGAIRFEGERPVLRTADEPDQPIGDMSGFERRAFGIAYSMALVEATGRRFPLMIDTPLGNADSDYRVRTLEALSAVDLEQVILLAHNVEAPASLVAKHDHHVQQTFLVQYDPQQRASQVMPNSYFFPYEEES